MSTGMLRAGKEPAPTAQPWMDTAPADIDKLIKILGLKQEKRIGLPRIDEFRFARLVQRARLHLPAKENHFFDRLIRIDIYCQCIGLFGGTWGVHKLARKMGSRKHPWKFGMVGGIFCMFGFPNFFQIATESHRRHYNERLNHMLGILIDKEHEKYRRVKRLPGPETQKPELLRTLTEDVLQSHGNPRAEQLNRELLVSKQEDVDQSKFKGDNRLLIGNDTNILGYNKNSSAESKKIDEKKLLFLENAPQYDEHGNLIETEDDHQEGVTRIFRVKAHNEAGQGRIIGVLSVLMGGSSHSIGVLSVLMGGRSRYRSRDVLCKSSPGKLKEVSEMEEQDLPDFSAYVKDHDFGYAISEQELRSLANDRWQHLRLLDINSIQGYVLELKWKKNTEGETLDDLQDIRLRTIDGRYRISGMQRSSAAFLYQERLRLADNQEYYFWTTEKRRTAEYLLDNGLSFDIPAEQNYTIDLAKDEEKRILIGTISASSGSNNQEGGTTSESDDNINDIASTSVLGSTTSTSVLGSLTSSFNESADLIAKNRGVAIKESERVNHKPKEFGLRAYFPGQLETALSTPISTDLAQDIAPPIHDPFNRNRPGSPLSAVIIQHRNAMKSKELVVADNVAPHDTTDLEVIKPPTIVPEFRLPGSDLGFGIKIKRGEAAYESEIQKLGIEDGSPENILKAVKDNIKAYKGDNDEEKQKTVPFYHGRTMSTLRKQLPGQGPTSDGTFIDYRKKLETAQKKETAMRNAARDQIIGGGQTLLTSSDASPLNHSAGKVIDTDKDIAMGAAMFSHAQGSLLGGAATLNLLNPPKENIEKPEENNWKTWLKGGG